MAKSTNAKEPPAPDVPETPSSEQIAELLKAAEGDLPPGEPDEEMLALDLQEKDKEEKEKEKEEKEEEPAAVDDPRLILELSNDPVQLYLKEIGLVDLLNPFRTKSRWTFLVGLLVGNHHGRTLQ